MSVDVVTVTRPDSVDDLIDWVERECRPGGVSNFRDTLRRKITNTVNAEAVGATVALSPDTRRMNDLLALSHIPRWAIVRTLYPQSVADHSYRTAVIAVELNIRIHTHDPAWTGNLDPVELASILLWSLVHDGPESQTGDIPGHFKVDQPDFIAKLREAEIDRCSWFGDYLRFNHPTDRVLRLVKVAEMIEQVSFMWMNKCGSHGDSVWRWLHGRLYGICVSNAAVIGVDPELLSLIARKMVGEIESEMGRLGV